MLVRARRPDKDINGDRKPDHRMRLSCFGLACALFWTFVGTDAHATSQCKQWRILDNGWDSGWSNNAQGIIDQWVEATDMGARMTGMAPVSKICIQNANPGQTFPWTALLFKWASWS